VLSLLCQHDTKQMNDIYVECIFVPAVTAEVSTNTTAVMPKQANIAMHFLLKLHN